MFELLEYVAGGVVLAFYLFVAVVLPTAVMVVFVLLIGTLLRTAIDPVVEALPEGIRTNGALASIGRPLRGLVIRGVGVAIFLALVGVATTGPSPGVLIGGFQEILVTLTAIQDIVATWITGQNLNDMLILLQPAPGEAQLAGVRLLENLVTTHLYQELKPGVTATAFRWTFAAFASALVAVYVVLEPVRAIRRRLASSIAPQPIEATINEATPAATPMTSPCPTRRRSAAAARA